VVVADDSRLMRRILVRALEEGGIEVVGEAADGDEALALCASQRPDAMTLDLHMPGTDGLAVLRALGDGPGGRPRVPSVVVSAFSPAHGARAVDALAEGAFDLAAKPAVGESVAAFSEALCQKLHAAASTRTRLAPAPVAVPRPRAARVAPVAPAAPAAPRAARRSAAGPSLVLIACSTGGPKALAELMPGLPSPLGAGVLIVQHMPPGFTGSLAARLDNASPLAIREAVAGDTVAPGTALVAPGGSHLRMSDPRNLGLSDEAAIGGLRPRADLTILDAARHWGPKLLLVVLTGMGRDGLDGAREVRKHGGRILVEAEETCTIYGMPRAVAEAGLADGVIPLNKMAEAIVAEANA
jgi:two-component system chemotaxis response regulator CheB